MICYDPLYIFKGARSAPSRAGHCDGLAPHDATADCNAAQRQPGSWLAATGSCSARRRLPSFGPPGHVGADAHSPPRPTARATRRNVNGGARSRGGGPSLRRPHSEALQAHGQGRTSSLRCGRSTLTVSLDRDSIGAYRRNGQDRTLAGYSLSAGIFCRMKRLIPSTII